jgi:zinc finger CCHC domain-containing protein 9
MTRVTDLGRKRKYVEAGFATEPSSTSSQLPASELKTVGEVSSPAQGDSAPAKKKRKRTKKPKATDSDQKQPGDSKPAEETNGEVKGERAFSVPKEVKKSKKDRGGKCEPSNGSSLSLNRAGCLTTFLQPSRSKDMRSVPSSVDLRE